MTEKYLAPATTEEMIRHAKWLAQQRAQDPIWAAIGETTRFIRGTEEGRKIARNLIQAYLKRERTRA